MARMFITTDRRSVCGEGSVGAGDSRKDGSEERIHREGERQTRDAPRPRVRRLAVILPSGHRDLGS